MEKYRVTVDLMLSKPLGKAMLAEIAGAVSATCNMDQHLGRLLAPYSGDGGYFEKGATRRITPKYPIASSLSPVELQREWINVHGGDLRGYQYTYGHGLGADIFAADMAKLHELEERR